jgi:hypothetical protein
MRRFIALMCMVATLLLTGVALLMFSIMPDLSGKSIAVHALIYTMQTLLFINPLVTLWMGHMIINKRI